MEIRENFGLSVSGAITSKSLKKSRAARAKDDQLDHQYRDFANRREKWTPRQNDALKIRLVETVLEPKNMPMNGQEG